MATRNERGTEKEQEYACLKRQRNRTARSGADVGQVGVRRGGGFSEWERLCCVKRSRGEGGLAGPSGLAEKRGGTGGSASRWFCSRKPYRGTTRVVEVFCLPTADVGSPFGRLAVAPARDRLVHPAHHTRQAGPFCLYPSPHPPSL